MDFDTQQAAARAYQSVRARARQDFLAFATANRPPAAHPAAWHAHHQGIFDAINPHPQFAFFDAVTTPFRRHDAAPSPELTHYLDRVPNILRQSRPPTLHTTQDAIRHAATYSTPPSPPYLRINRT